MDSERVFQPLRWVSHVVLALMVAALLYAAFISVWHWPGISV